eukprot:7378723-Prymnesium_polylepis.1
MMHVCMCAVGASTGSRPRTRRGYAPWLRPLVLEGQFRVVMSRGGHGGRAAYPGTGKRRVNQSRDTSLSRRAASE